MQGFLSLACLVIVASFTITSSSLATSSNNPPQISVSQSENNGSLQFSMLNETLVIISKYTTQNVVLSCSASYPVMWSLSSLDNHWVVDGSIQAERRVGNFTDKSTYKYSMRVSINNHVNMNSTSQLPETFICVRADLNATNRDLLLSTASSSRMVVIWESNIWPYWNDLRKQLVVDGEYHIYLEEEAAANQQQVNWILIPCYSLNANETKVEFLKRINYRDGDTLEGEGKLLLLVDEKDDDASRESDSFVLLRFEPYVGFYLNALAIHSDVEIYECRARRQQVATASVTPGNHNSAANYTRIFKLIKSYKTADSQFIGTGGARLAETGSQPLELSTNLFELNIQSPELNISLTPAYIKCCLTSGNNEQWSSANFIFYYKSCNQPLMCLANKYRKSFSHSIRDQSYVLNSSCRQIYYYRSSKYFSPASPNLFVCHLRTDEKLTQYVQFPDTYEINEATSETSYVLKESNSEETSSLKFFTQNDSNRYERRLRKANELSNIQFYTDEIVQVSCKATPFYYANGTLWEKGWENGTKEFVREAVNDTQQYSASPPLFTSYNLILKIVAGLASIKCYIPPWSTTTWITHSLSFATEPSRHPASPNGQTTIHENVTFYTGENKTLECDFDGSPTPKFIWRILNSGSHCNSSRAKGCYVVAEVPWTISGRRFSGWLWYKYYDITKTSLAKIANPTAPVLHYNSHSSEIPPAGEASCSATNLVGTATKYFYLQAIRSQRPIMKEPTRESVSLFVGDEGSSLACSVLQAAPEPTFSWKKHETDIEHFSDYYAVAESANGRGNVSTLTFKKVRYEDDGDYTCVASNFLGNASHIFNVRVRERSAGAWAEVAVIFLSVALISMVGLFVYMTVSKRNLSQLQPGVVEYSSRGREGGGAESLQGSQVTLRTN